MGKVPAARMGSHPQPANDADLPSLAAPSAFQRELERARRHLARLEAEEALRREPSGIDDAQFDESPALVRVCNALIWAIVLLPILLAVLALARRVAG